ncbi:MAG: hypothetical protein JWQ11_4442, partial [Rhizobacter sp.]|nr:hypothetical protein [Rhizobacter sp.]
MTSTRRLVISSFAALIGLFLVFQLPYLRPPTVRTISASYDYGFDNSLGILVLAATALFFVGAGFAWMKRPSAIAMTSAHAGDEITRRPLWIMTFVSLLLIGALASISSDFGFGESTQFVLALERLSLGQTIYAQFDFYYGPLLAYGPYAIFELGHWLHLDLKTAYFIALALFQWAGLLELRFLIDALDVTPRQRRWMFYTVALATLPFHSGINLILFRFLTPVAGLLLLRRAERLGVGMRCLLMVGLSLLTFGISVEYGVVLAVSLAIYYGGSFAFDRRPSNLMYVAVALASPVLCYFAFPGLFNTVHLYLMGAWRWPFVLSLPLVTFFFAVWVLAFATGSMLNDIRRNYFAVVLCILAVGSLPAALGRCDPGHLMLNGLTVMLLAWAFVARSMAGRSRVVFGVLLVVGIGLTNIVAALRLYAPLYTSLAFRVVARHVPPDTMARLARGAASSLHLDQE